MRYMLPHNKQSTAGFTLIEMLVMAPVVLLAIGGFVALMVSMVGDTLATRDYNTMTYETQDSLSRIEQDVRLSTQFLTTTGTNSPQQGSDNNTAGTAPFTITSTNNTLILNMPATDKNPTDTTKQLIYYANQPNPCGGSQTSNQIFTTKVVYFIKNGSLWRRTILPPYDTNNPIDNNTVCSLPWQQNSCNPGYTAGGSCQTNDAEIMKNISTLSVQYFATPSSTTNVGVAGAASATTLSATITGQSTSAGRTIATSQSVRATKLNVIDNSNPQPLAVTSQPNNVSALFNDTNVTISAQSSIPTAAVIWQRSTDGGNTWQIMSGQNSATLTIPTIDQSWDGSQFRAIFAYGSSSVTTNTATLSVSLWGGLALQNGWGTYAPGSDYTGGLYTKTSAGLVMLKGLISGGSTSFDSLITTLPSGYRPDSRLTFFVGSYNSSSNASFGRVDVLPNGEVHFMSGSSSWVSLDAIKFISATATCTASTNLTFANGWSNYGGSYAPFSLCKDTTGRIDSEGLIQGGTTTSGTQISPVPAGYQSAQDMIVPAVDSTGVFGSTGIYSSSMVARGMMTSYLSTNNLYIANNGAVTWKTPTILNGMVNYGGSFTTIQYGKTSDGVVMIKGLLKGGTVSNGTVVFTLPSGYRPSSRMLLTGVANQHSVRIDVGINGDVIIQSSGDTAWTSFDAISFLSDGS